MLIDVKTTRQIDIDEYEAFRILCKTLHMEFVLNTDINFRVEKDVDGENRVYVLYNEPYDDRGDLFVALRNVAVNLFPNLEFRGEKYIYNK